MKNLLFPAIMLLMLMGASFGLTVPQAQANALNCIELIKFSAELSSPSLNNFMLKSKKIVFDKQSGTVFIMEKATGNIQFKYYDKNRKTITGKTLSETYNNAYKKAAYFEIEISNKFLYKAKLTITYGSSVKRHENLSINGVLSVISGKEKIPYKFTENVKVAELSSAKTVISSGILKSEGTFNDLIIIDFSSDQLKTGINKTTTVSIFNTDKRSQKIDNLRYILTP
ncbi:MAG: hypothetical protein V1752_00450 [Candidatus Firestonebacteria bacterium]